MTVKTERDIPEARMAVKAFRAYARAIRRWIDACNDDPELPTRTSTVIAASRDDLVIVVASGRHGHDLIEWVDDKNFLVQKDTRR